MRIISWLFSKLFRLNGITAQYGFLRIVKEHAKAAYPVLKRALLLFILIGVAVLAFNIVMPIYKLENVLGRFVSGGGGGHGYAAMLILGIVGFFYVVVFIFFFPAIILLLLQKYLYGMTASGIWNKQRQSFVELLALYVNNQVASNGSSDKVGLLLQYQQLRKKLPAQLGFMYRFVAAKVPLLKQLDQLPLTDDDWPAQLNAMVGKEKEVSPAWPILLVIVIVADVAGVLYFVQ
jgi:hypothetical protein